MRRGVRHERMDYVIADGDYAPHESLWWAVVRTRAVDELTEAPPLNRIALSTTTPGCLPRVADDGLCGLVARPGTVAAQLLGAGRLTAEIRADGYLPRSLTAAIDAARRTTDVAALGATQLTVAPAEPAPPAPRRQFLPGRGVLLESRTPGRSHELTLNADPLVAPAPDIVPLADAVREVRPIVGAPWQVAGVPLILPDQPLHRAQPALVRGRVLRQPVAGATPVAATGARIGLTGVWWTFGEIPASSAPPHLPDFVAFGAPLAFDHAAGAALARLSARVPDGVARALAEPARAGATEIELSDASGLTAAGGDTLELEPANSAEREIVLTAGFVAPAAPVTRATVRLRTPLAFAHRRATPVENAALTFTALGTLAREAQRGDRVLFSSTLSGVGTEDVLRVAGAAPASTELRFARRMPFYDGTLFHHLPAIGADGGFTLPPVARVAQLQLFVHHAGQAAHPRIDLVPDYRSDTALQILFMP